MIWIVGEYAERIDNADEILQSFLDGFHDENTQVIFLHFRRTCPTWVIKSVKQLLYVIFVKPGTSLNSPPGATAIADCYCEVVPKEASRDPGAGTEGSFSSHSGL